MSPEQVAARIGTAIITGHLSSVFTPEYHQAVDALDAAGMPTTRDVLPRVVLYQVPMDAWYEAVEADLGVGVTPFYFGSVV